MTGEGFSLEYFPSLIFYNDTFQYLGKSHLYADVSSISYHALVIKRTIGFIPDGSDYQIQLQLTLSNGNVLDIQQESPRSGWGEKDRAEALMRASSILHDATFVQRIRSYESDLERKKHAAWGGYQFATNGDVFRDHLLLFNVKSESVTLRLHPFAIELANNSNSLKQKISKLWHGNEVVELTQDRDCFFYFMKHYVGFFWKNEPVRDRIVDHENNFLKSILILGGKICKADGRVDKEEISAFKRFFGIDEKSIPGAGDIFSAATKSPEGVDEAAQAIFSIFKGQDDILENLVVGLLQVAASDGVITTNEADLIRRVCAKFHLSDQATDRLFLIFAQMDESNQDWGSSETGFSQTRSEYLMILELSEEASHDEIKAAYRRLASKHHPDALIAQGLPMSRIKESEEILKSVNLAYDWLSRNKFA